MLSPCFSCLRGCFESVSTEEQLHGFDLNFPPPSALSVIEGVMRMINSTE